MPPSAAEVSHKVLLALQACHTLVGYLLGKLALDLDILCCLAE